MSKLIGVFKKSIIFFLSVTVLMASLPYTSLSVEAKTNYKYLYGSYIKKHDIPVDNVDVDVNGAFIYLDNDDIPECLINIIGNVTILTIHNGHVKVIYTAEAPLIKYKKKKGLIYSDFGEQGAKGMEGYTTWQKLNDGKLRTLASYTRIIYDYGNEYLIGKKRVSHSTYRKSLQKTRKKYKGGWSKIKYVPYYSLGLTDQKPHNVSMEYSDDYYTDEVYTKADLDNDGKKEKISFVPDKMNAWNQNEVLYIYADNKKIGTIKENTFKYRFGIYQASDRSWYLYLYCASNTWGDGKGALYSISTNRIRKLSDMIPVGSGNISHRNSTSFYADGDTLTLTTDVDKVPGLGYIDVRSSYKCSGGNISLVDGSVQLLSYDDNEMEESSLDSLVVSNSFKIYSDRECSAYKEMVPEGTTLSLDDVYVNNGFSSYHVVGDGYEGWYSSTDWQEAAAANGDDYFYFEDCQYYDGGAS